MTDTPAVATELIGVLDMGASAIRLVVAEIDSKRNVRVIEEASRGVLLGRDTFSGGVIRSQTMDAALEALEGFREIMDGYGVHAVRAVATSAVREARNADMFLDRIQGRTGIGFEIINEAEESRLVYLAVRHALRRHPALQVGARTLLIEVGGGSTSLTLLRRGQPTRSGVYALGAVRLRQQLDLRRHTHELQVALLKRYIANVVEEIRVEIPLDRITHVIAIGGDVRFAASQLTDQPDAERPRRWRATSSSRSATRSSGWTRTGWSIGSGCRRSKPKPCCRRCSSTARCSPKPPARRLVVSNASLRAGVLLDVAEPKNRVTAARTSSTRCWPAPRRSDSATASIADHGQHVAMLATRLFDELGDEHGLGDRERLLLQVSGAAARRRRLRQPARASQAFAVHPRRVADLRAVRTRKPPSSRTSPATIAAACRRTATCRSSRSTATIA